MPDSKADLARRSNEEIVNFHDHGDARGRRWLDTHPADRQAAERRLEHTGDPAEEG